MGEGESRLSGVLRGKLGVFVVTLEGGFGSGGATAVDGSAGAPTVPPQRAIEARSQAESIFGEPSLPQRQPR